MLQAAPVVDKNAIARAGMMVRSRLAADPGVYKVPTEKAEIYCVSDFLTPADCAGLIATIDTVAKPSAIYGEDRKAAGRTSYSGDVDPTNPLVRKIERRICDLMGLDLAWGETVQGQRYLPGQEFKHHYDWFNTRASYWPREVRNGGQRCWTAMAYLNDVEEGGVTEFNMLGLSIPPQAGLLLMWNNARENGEPNPDTMHAGTPVVRGQKYIITKWFRTRPWGK